MVLSEHMSCHLLGIMCHVLRLFLVVSNVYYHIIHFYKELLQFMFTCCIILIHSIAVATLPQCQNCDIFYVVQ